MTIIMSAVRIIEVPQLSKELTLTQLASKGIPMACTSRDIELAATTQQIECTHCGSVLARDQFPKGRRTCRQCLSRLRRMSRAKDRNAAIHKLLVSNSYAVQREAKLLRRQSLVDGLIKRFGTADQLAMTLHELIRDATNKGDLRTAASLLLGIFRVVADTAIADESLAQQLTA